MWERNCSETRSFGKLALVKAISVSRSRTIRWDELCLVCCWWMWHCSSCPPGVLCDEAAVCEPFLVTLNLSELPCELPLNPFYVDVMLKVTFRWESKRWEEFKWISKSCCSVWASPERIWNKADWYLGHRSALTWTFLPQEPIPALTCTVMALHRFLMSNPNQGSSAELCWFWLGFSQHVWNTLLRFLSTSRQAGEQSGHQSPHQMAIS